MHTNYYKVVKLLKSFTILIVAPTCIGIVAAATATIPTTSNNDICYRSQQSNFSEAQAERSLMMVYVNRNMLEQLLLF